MIRLVAQQALYAGRLTLVPLGDAHLQWEVKLDSDPEVMRYLSGRASTREEVRADHARRMAYARKVDGLGFWVGLVDDEFVGWWTLQPAHGPDQPDDPGVADLGYRLLRCQWRKGLATAGALELVRYGFDDVRLDRIIAQTLRVNVASRAVMERVGLTYVRTFPTSTTDPVEGVEEGEVEYEMTREQWTYRATQLGKLGDLRGRSIISNRSRSRMSSSSKRRRNPPASPRLASWRHSATLRAVDAAAAFVGQDLTPTRLANSS